MSDRKAVPTAFLVGPFADGNGNILGINFLPDLTTDFSNSKMLLKAWDPLKTEVDGRVSKFNPDGTIEVTLNLFRTGPHTLQLYTGGSPLFPEPLAVQVPPGELLTQAMPAVCTSRIPLK
jgi:hypothetical protein